MQVNDNFWKTKFLQRRGHFSKFFKRIITGKWNRFARIEPQLGFSSFQRSSWNQEVFNALHEGFNALPEVFNALPEVFNTLPKVFNALPEVFNALREVFNAFPEVFNALQEVFNALPEDFNAF
jgi:hypothetical protein